ncbi:hypothetical protein C7M84_018233 [Penaeus vannamei]|uniref:Uncharacterized protein n=1 Tax=Penaeus vannamei TaxID=6689 RepID=A0A423SI36_PENVA|nr:hypothetical protein C7M84_018233 [Penaeus vannamei]
MKPLPLRLPSPKAGQALGVLAAGAVGGAAFRGPRGRALPAVVGAGFGGSWLPGPSEGLPSVAPGAEPCRGRRGRLGGSWLPGPSEGLPSVAPGAEPCPRSCGLRARADNYRGEPPSAAAGWRRAGKLAVGAGRGPCAGVAGASCWKPPLRLPSPKAGQALGVLAAPWPRAEPCPRSSGQALGVLAAGAVGGAAFRGPGAEPCPRSGAGFGGSWLPGPSEGLPSVAPGAEPCRGSPCLSGSRPRKRGRLWGDPGCRGRRRGCLPWPPGPSGPCPAVVWAESARADNYSVLGWAGTREAGAGPLGPEPAGAGRPRGRPASVAGGARGGAAGFAAVGPLLRPLHPRESEAFTGAWVVGRAEGVLSLGVAQEEPLFAVVLAEGPRRQL